MKNGNCKIIVRGLMPVPSIPSGPVSYRPFEQIEIECPASSFDGVWSELVKRGLLPERKEE